METHLVRAHGHERKYTCEYCGTQFIHQRHYRRHMQKHENNPDKIYRTQTIRRGYTKKTGKYWHEKTLAIDPGADRSVPDKPEMEIQSNEIIISQALPNTNIPNNVRVITTSNFPINYPLTFHNL